MRFLVDECAGPRVARWLREQGHDVVSVFESQRGAPDELVLSLAHADRRILITADHDFGEHVYRQRRPHHGVVLLRLADQRAEAKVQALAHLTSNYADRLAGAFVVVTAQRVRFARPRA